MDKPTAPAGKADILSMTEEEIVSFVSSELSEPAYRGAQIYSWIGKGVPVDGMTNLPAALRRTLKEKVEYNIPKIVKKLSSEKDGTVKYLFELSDGERV